METKTPKGETMPVNPTTKLSDLIKGNKRGEGESFEDYKRRRTLEAALTKRILRGRLVWDGKTGTYRKDGPND